MDRNLRSSKNYIWNTNAVLGKGATSSVLQGMNKQTGELVAIKEFNNAGCERPNDVQRREYEVLSKVNHENIVRLLAIEEESESLKKVLVMELCTGGSLFNILDDPSNSFGLQEHEFLLVLKHLTAGMKHLRDMNIIHRDLKPGNIMKFISDDGQSIYKLTDFGAARELEEDQQFVSLYGTEEYLHPEVYAKAVLKKPTMKSFSAKVDLWSIGVTLFHLATGSLPFRPYGGRKNKEMMHRITTEKKQGIISGIQHSENGDIEWNANLPKTCLLNPSLQVRVTALLVGLLEYNQNNMWTFERFFQTVLQILKPAVHVFCLNNVCNYTFYLLQSEKISNLKTYLAESTQIQVKNQLIIWNKQEIQDNHVMIFNTQDNPLILLNRQATTIKAVNFVTPNQFKFPEILNVVVPNTGEHDAQQSKACSSIAYCISRAINKCLQCCTTINQVPQQVMSRIEINVRLLNEKRDSCSHSIGFLKDQIEFTAETMSNLYKCIKLIDPNSTFLLNHTETDRLREDFSRQLDMTWKELLPKIIDITKRVDNLTDRWENEQSSKHLSNMTTSKARADTLCSLIKDGWHFLHKNRSSKSLGGHERQLQHLEKLRIDTNCKKLLRLLHEDTHPTLNEVVERLDDWYNDAHVVLVQSACLMSELSRLMETRQRLQYRFDAFVEIQHKNWSAFMKQLNVLKNEGNNASENNQKKQSQIQQQPQHLGSTWHKFKNESTKPRLTFQGQLSNIRSSSCSRVDQFDGCERHLSSQHLMEEVRNLTETCNSLYVSLSENQNLFSEVVGIMSSKTASDSGQY